MSTRAGLVKSNAPPPALPATHDCNAHSYSYSYGRYMYELKAPSTLDRFKETFQRESVQVHRCPSPMAATLTPTAIAAATDTGPDLYEPPPPSRRGLGPIPYREPAGPTRTRVAGACHPQQRRFNYRRPRHKRDVVSSESANSISDSPLRS